MKKEIFAKFMKQIVKECLREELPKLLNENKISNNLSFTSDKITPTFNKQTFNYLLNEEDTPQQPEEKNNPYLSFILEAGQNMSAQDKAGLTNL